MINIKRNSCPESYSNINKLGLSLGPLTDLLSRYGLEVVAPTPCLKDPTTWARTNSPQRDVLGSNQCLQNSRDWWTVAVLESSCTLRLEMILAGLAAPKLPSAKVSEWSGSWGHLFSALARHALVLTLLLRTLCTPQLHVCGLPCQQSKSASPQGLSRAVVFAEVVLRLCSVRLPHVAITLTCSLALQLYVAATQGVDFLSNALTAGPVRSQLAAPRNTCAAISSDVGSFYGLLLTRQPSEPRFQNPLGCFRDIRLHSGVLGKKDRHLCC